jgi:hypothetical protein
MQTVYFVGDLVTAVSLPNRRVQLYVNERTGKADGTPWNIAVSEDMVVTWNLVRTEYSRGIAIINFFDRDSGKLVHSINHKPEQTTTPTGARLYQKLSITGALSTDGLVLFYAIGSEQETLLYSYAYETTVFAVNTKNFMCVDVW